MIKTGYYLQFLFLFITCYTVQAQCVSGDCDNGKGIYIYPSGAKYIGEFQNGEIHGEGICHYTDGSKYQGQWNYRYPEGQGTKTYKDGVQWTGTWKKGKPIDANGNFIEEMLVSKGEATNDGTDIQAGCIKGDCQNGKGTFAYADGSKYQGQFINGRLEGWGTWYFVNGDKYIGAFQNNYVHGRGTLYKTNGEKTVGDWKEGEYMGNSLIEKGRLGCIKGDCQNGQGTFIYKNGSAKYIGHFINSKPHGEGICYYANGARYKGQWADGKFSGLGTLFQTNNTEVEGQWANGIYKGKTTKQPLVATEKKEIHPPQAPTPTNSQSDDLKVWALIVGVASYNHMPVLRYTDDDAYRMYAFLKSPEGGALSDDHIRILVDEDATKGNILDIMDELFSKAGDNDLVMLYFSGHGLKGSFLPIDFDGFKNKVYHEEINTIFEKSNAKYKLCIADACHSGSLLAARSGSVSNTLANYYKSLAQAKAGSALIMSSKSEETSLESSGLRQGVFSHFLIRGLKGEADVDYDKIVTVQELFNYVETNVKDYTGMLQTPLIMGNYDKKMTVAVRR